MNARYIAILITLCGSTPALSQQMRLPSPTRADAATVQTLVAERRGFFASLDWLAYNAASYVDAQGGVHLAFYFSDERHDHEKRDQAAYYTYCPGTEDCTDASSWTWLIQFDTAVNEVQVVATDAGQPRILVRRNGSRAYEYDYFACDDACTDGMNWYGLRVYEAAGVDLWTAEMPQHSFALDALGRPRFVYPNGWGIGRPTAIYYAWCDTDDCTEPGSWQDTPIFGPIDGYTITSDYATLVFDGVNPRVLTRMNRSGLPERVQYQQCDGDCSDPSNWSVTEIPHPDGNKMWANWDLELDPMGRPRIALYESQPIDLFVGGKLYYGWCDGDCSEDDAFEITPVAYGEGKNVDLEIDSRGRTYMVYDAGQRGVLGTVWCDGACSDSTAWDRAILETSEDLAEEFWPANPLSCSDEQRAWLDAIPNVGFDRNDGLVIGYDLKNVAICYYEDPTNPTDPPYSHVERIWWTVRLGFFGRPDRDATPVDDPYEMPTTASLEPNFPNPFNPTTTIPFVLQEGGPVRLTVHDLLGRTVAVLADGVQPAGEHTVTWDATGFSSGIYVYRLETQRGQALSRTLTLLK